MVAQLKYGMAHICTGVVLVLLFARIMVHLNVQNGVVVHLSVDDLKITEEDATNTYIQHKKPPV